MSGLFNRIFSDADCLTIKFDMIYVNQVDALNKGHLDCINVIIKHKTTGIKLGTMYTDYRGSLDVRDF